MWNKLNLVIYIKLLFKLKENQIQIQILIQIHIKNETKIEALRHFLVLFQLWHPYKKPKQNFSKPNHNQIRLQIILFGFNFKKTEKLKTRTIEPIANHNQIAQP